MLLVPSPEAFETSLSSLRPGFYQRQVGYFAMVTSLRLWPHMTIHVLVFSPTRMSKSGVLVSKNLGFLSEPFRPRMLISVKVSRAQSVSFLSPL